MAGGSKLYRRRRALGYITEVTEGVFLEPSTSASVTPGYIANIIDASYEIEPFRFETNFSTPTLTPSLPRSTGVAGVTFTFTVELSSDEDIGADPSVDQTGSVEGTAITRLFRYCGLKTETDVCYVVPDPDIGGGEGDITGGPLQHLDGFSTPAAPVDAAMRGDYFELHPHRIWARPDTADFTTGDITTDSGASMTVLSQSGARMFVSRRADPNSSTGGFGVGTGSVELYADGLVIQGSGCRGNVVFNCEHANAVQCTFTLRGILEDVKDLGYIPDATQNISQETPQGYFGVNLTASRYVDASTIVESQDITHNSLTLDLGNNLLLREDSSAPNGAACAIITGWNPTVTFNADAELFDPDGVASNGDEFGWLDVYKDALPFQLRFEVGADSTELAVPVVHGNSFDFMCNGCVITALSDDERDNIDVFGVTASMTTGEYPDGSKGVDNDFFLGIM